MSFSGPRRQRRRAARVPIVLVFVRDDDESFLGRSRNLSESGVYVETTSRPKLGSTHILCFKWGRDSCVVKARVVRFDETGVSFEFVDNDVYNLRMIRDVIVESTE